MYPKSATPQKPTKVPPTPPTPSTPTINPQPPPTAKPAPIPSPSKPLPLLDLLGKRSLKFHSTSGFIVYSYLEYIYFICMYFAFIFILLYLFTLLKKK
jgi:hypothetical protein